MLKINSRESSRLCDGIHRRRFIEVDPLGRPVHLLPGGRVPHELL